MRGMWLEQRVHLRNMRMGAAAMARAWRMLECVLLLGMLAGCGGTSAPFADDFSDPASGWGVASHEAYVRGYQQGRYLMQIDASRWFVWATAGRVYEDAAVEVIVRSEGSVDNHYGVVCRYQEEQFYYFSVSADGYYAIFKHTESGVLEPLTGPAMLRSPLVHTDGAENLLLAVCEGARLTLYVNGEQVAQVKDATLTRGDVGLAAGSVDQGGTIVWFDNFDVRKP